MSYGAISSTVSMDSEHAIPGSLIDGRELMEATVAQLEMLGHKHMR